MLVLAATRLPNLASRALAVDGKYVRGQVLTLCLSERETGAPVSMAIAAPAARRRYPQTERNGALVTAAARHCEPETRRHLVERGGDSLVQLIANQPTALAKAATVAATASPLLPAPRLIAATAGLTPAGSKSSRWNRWTYNLPSVRRLTVVRKTSAVGTAPDVATTSYYLGSRLPGPAKHSAEAIRGHWGGCEIRNHWVRDALWDAARTRSKNWQLNANLAVLRAGLIALRAQRAPHLSWPVRFERAAHQPACPFRLVTKSAPL